MFTVVIDPEKFKIVEDQILGESMLRDAFTVSDGTRKICKLLAPCIFLGEDRLGIHRETGNICIPIGYDKWREVQGVHLEYTQ